MPVRPSSERFNQDKGDLDDFWPTHDTQTGAVYRPIRSIYADLVSLAGAQRDEDLACMFDTDVLCLRTQGWDGVKRPG